MKPKFLFLAMFLLASFSMRAQILCNASFSYSTSPSGTVTFYSTSTTISNTQTFNWNFGNGTGGFGTQVTCAYNTPGTYTVCLYVIDSLSACSDSSCATITIASTSPCASSFTFASNTSGAPYTFDFTNTSTGSGLSYLWYWNDGTPYDTSMNPTHTFPGAGPYTVSLSVWNANGCSDSTWQVVSNGSGNPCNAYFTVIPDTSAGAAPHTYIGFNWSTGNALTYTWIWGDGSANGTGAYPSHTYASAGTYNICLVVMGAGCVDSFCSNQILNKTESMVTINFQNPTGLNNVTKTQATIYPNPADDKLFIKGNANTNYQVEIFNLNGSKMMSTSTKGNHPIDITALPTNLYMVKVTDANGKSDFAKFMKQ